MAASLLPAWAVGRLGAVAAAATPGALVGVLVAALLVYYTVIVPLRRVSFYSRQGIRGSSWRWLRGDMAHLAAQRAAFKPFNEWFRDWDESYGRLNYFFFGPEFRLRICDAGYAQAVLVNHASAFLKPALMKRTMGTLLGEGLLLSEDPVHGRHAKMIKPAFHWQRLKGMTPLMARLAGQAIDQWLQQAAPGAAPAAAGAAGANPSAPRDMHEALSALTLDIISRAAFGSELGGSPQKAAEVYDSLGELLSAMVHNVQSIRAFIPGFQRLLRFAPGNSHIPDQINRLRSLLRKMIMDRRAQRDAQRAAAAAAKAAGAAAADDASSGAGGCASAGSASEILVDFLLDAEDEEGSSARHMTDTEILDNGVTLILAGHETTAQALSWAMVLLSWHPEWKTRAREEVHRVLGRDREPSYDDLAHLPLVHAIVLETMRLFPPAPMVVREVKEDVTLHPTPAKGGGPATAAAAAAEAASKASPTDALALPPSLRLTKGTTLTIAIASIHRNPFYFTNPDAFAPDRFLGVPSVPGGAPSIQRAGGGSHMGAYIPFSSGPRECIGQQFAMLEARIILATLLQKLDWRLDAGYRHSPAFAVTLRPAFGVPMHLSPAP